MTAERAIEIAEEIYDKLAAHKNEVIGLQPTSAAERATAIVAIARFLADYGTAIR